MKKWMVMGCIVLLVGCAASESQLAQEATGIKSVIKMP